MEEKSTVQHAGGNFQGFFLVILELVTFPEWTSSDPGGAAQHQMLHFSL